MSAPFTVTFYSYKGGVGRSLLAANAGYLLARGGKTLLWDLDIEAPGLHFIQGLNKPETPVSKGFFEWLKAWQDKARPATSADFKALAKLARPCPISDRLYVLPAFAEGADPAALYQQIRWDAFLSDDLDAGLALFRGALEAFAAAGFEHVILDSRTGITDIGGMLAALLPHATVLVGNYGRQNTEGLARVWKALAPAEAGQLGMRGDLPPLSRLLVASPIPSDETNRIAAGREVWSGAFGVSLSEIVEVPWTASLLFAEELLASREPDSPTARAYAALAERLRRLREAIEADSRQAERSDAAHPDLLPGKRGSRAEQGKSFEERVAHLLRLLGYRVEAEQLVDANRVDLVARKRADFGREEVYFIECKEHREAVAKSVLETLHHWLDGAAARQMQARGMVVASRDFSPAARAYARDHGLQALSYDELERSLFDFSPYLARIRQRFEASALAATYVDQFVRLEKSEDDEPVALLPHAEAWARGEGSRLWLVLGDYGTGKSAFVERLAYELAKACEDDRDAPVPIAINLKYFPNAISLESLIREHLEAELRSVLSPEVVLHLLDAGRVVLLLDSFDEMGVAQAGRSIEEQFRQLARATAGAGRNARANRVLITSRSHFFRDQGSVQRAAQGNGDSLFEPESPLGKVARSFDATIDELPVFTEAQVRDYLARRLGRVEGERAWQKIGEVYGLRELAATPQLLEMIVTSLPELMTGGARITPAGLYLGYTNRWLGEVRPARAEVSVEHLRELLESLACELWCRPQNRIHYAELARLLRDTPGLARNLDSERVDLELRTAAFLVRSADGHYRFSHRSFLEFFFARRLYRHFKAEDLAAGLAHGFLNFEAIWFFLDMVGRNPEDQERLNAPVLAILAAPYRSGISENALVLASRSAHWRVDGDAFRAHNEGRDAVAVWYEAHQRLIPDAAQLHGAQLSNVQLDYVRLAGANLSGADLSKANLYGADLSHACLDGAVLDDVDLRDATLSGASLREASAQRIQGQHLEAGRSNWSQANLHAADLRHAHMSHADFSRASLRLARLAHARCVGTLFAGTHLDGASWPDADGLPCPDRARPATALAVGFSGHSGILTACAFAPDGRSLITASTDGSACLWDLASGKQIRRFEGHQHTLIACAIAPDGRSLMTTSADSSARFWDLASGKEIRRFEGHQGTLIACALAPDGRSLVTASDDYSARLWDLASGKEIRRFEGHQGTLIACAFAPDGRSLITASADGSARLWDLASSKEIRRFEGHQGGLYACAFAPDGRSLVTASDDRSARLWDLASGQEIRRFEGHQGGLYACAFAPDGHSLVTASTDRSARLWDLASGKEIRRFEGHQGGLNACAFAPDGRSLVTASTDRSARLWDLASGKELRRFEGHQGGLRACAFAPDGRSLVTASTDRSARLWGRASGQEIRRFEGHQRGLSACAFAPDGRSLVTASTDRTARLWDLASGQEIRRFEGHQGRLKACAFAPDGRSLVTASDDRTARLWDLASGQEIRRFEGHQGELNACAFAPDGRSLVTASTDGSARLWDLAYGKEIRRFKEHRGWLNACAFAPDGRSLITASTDGSARLWDFASGKEIRRFEGHWSWLNACAFAPDGRSLITASEDRSARLWDLASGKEIRRFEGHQGGVYACAFAPDGRSLITASDDGTARLWDLASGNELRAMSGSGTSWIAWTRHPCRWDGEGWLAEQLMIVDDDAQAPVDGALPTIWFAADLPDIKGLPPLKGPHRPGRRSRT